MKIICPYCNGKMDAPGPDYLPLFCTHCRKMLPNKFCKKCGHGVLHPDSNYCSKCGEKIEAAAV